MTQTLLKINPKQTGQRRGRVYCRLCVDVCQRATETECYFQNVKLSKNKNTSSNNQSNKKRLIMTKALCLHTRTTGKTRLRPVASQELHIGGRNLPHLALILCHQIFIIIFYTSHRQQLQTHKHIPSFTSAAPLIGSHQGYTSAHVDFEIAYCLFFPHFNPKTLTTL